MYNKTLNSTVSSGVEYYTSTSSNNLLSPQSNLRQQMLAKYHGLLDEMDKVDNPFHKDEILMETDKFKLVKRVPNSYTVTATQSSSNTPVWIAPSHTGALGQYYGTPVIGTNVSNPISYTGRWASLKPAMSILLIEKATGHIVWNFVVNKKGMALDFLSKMCLSPRVGKPLHMRQLGVR